MNIVFCTTVKNRTQHLRETLPQSLAGNPTSKFVILDYNTQDNLLDYLFAVYGDEIQNNRLAVYSHLDEPVFRMAHAKNLAHRCGILEGGDVLVNLDADNIAGFGFENYVTGVFTGVGDRDVFLWGNMIKGEMTRGVNGRIAVTKDGFLKTGGYDERKFNGWGSDDKDFNLRLRMIGLRGIEIPQAYLLGVPHNNKIRFKEYPHLSNLTDEYFEVSKATVERAIVNDGKFGCGIVYKNRDFSKPIVLRPLPTRIFGIGLHKTATTSLHHALEILGYESWHWSGAKAAKSIWREMNNWGHSPTMERFYALCDLPIPMLFEKLDQTYPGSKFILTIRDETSWLDTVQRHFDPKHNPWSLGWNTDPFTSRIHNLLYGRQDFDAEMFLSRYRQHNAHVKEYFRYRPDDLLVMHMDHGVGWPELCGFLGREIPDVDYPRSNGASGTLARVE